MTGSTGVAPQNRVEAHPSSGKVAWTVPRVAGSVAALVALYYLLPLDHSSTPAAVTMLLVGLAAFVALVACQVRLIIRSRFPGLRAAEALGTSVPFSCCFSPAPTSCWPRYRSAISAATYGLYFTVTVFSTVGFGDITAKTETARLVTGQMIADLIILGLAIKVIVGAVRHGRADGPADALDKTAPRTQSLHGQWQ